MEEIARTVGASADEVKSQMTGHFQALTEQIAKGLNKGLFKLIRNLAVRVMWNEYAMPEEVKMATFFTAVESFLGEQLMLPDAEVDAILSESNKIAIAATLDRDGDGKVCECVSV